MAAKVETIATKAADQSAGTIRVYSAWSGDNVMGHDDSTMWIKIWAVASA